MSRIESRSAECKPTFAGDPKMANYEDAITKMMAINISPSF